MGFLSNLSVLTGLEIMTRCLPMQPKIEHWQLNFQNWLPAGNWRLFCAITKDNHNTFFVFISLDREVIRIW